MGRAKKVYDSKIADMVKVTSILGTGAQDIINVLRRLGYDVPSIITFRKLYKKELCYREEFLIKIAHHAYKRALVSDRILEFVCKTQLGWKDTSHQQISIDQIPNINIICEHDESLERNKL